jgi:2-polyprenyl-6-hydroxyphenyl methylase/3-demethylubiquinone-9 3-methyltransferase
MNPVRIGWIAERLARTHGRKPGGVAPLAGLRVLDVGCGAGLLCEPLARMGAEVTGVDAAPENIDAATAHAALSGLPINYRAGEIAAQGLGQFDIVSSMEVIEHVNDPAVFIGELKRHMKPDGLLLLSTPNRTPASRIFLVEAAERLGQVPRGTHDWDKFLTPDELTAILNDAGIEIVDMQGIAFSPMSGLHLSSNMALNYILSARLRD